MERRETVWPWIVVVGALAICSCSERAVLPVRTPSPPPQILCTTSQTYLQKEVDLLFVVDNSNSMDEEQRNLGAQFPKLIEALRTASLGSDGSGKPCNANDTSGCRIPDVHIGVVSTDLGAGSYNVETCNSSGGDRGRLQNSPRVAGCTPPVDSWINYNAGMTNVAGASTDGVQKVKDAFSCIATLGVEGCAFEQTIESARRALDPELNVNPGFMRNDLAKNQDALLAIVFITDEDDCSAANTKLYDPSQKGLTDPLGPLTSFRCFEFGVTCQCPDSTTCDRTTTGARTNCVPDGTHLYKISDYLTFFKTLKKTFDGKPNPSRVLMAAIAGPADTVEVVLHGQNPWLAPGCQQVGSWATPAIRLKALVHTFARKLTAKETADVKAKKTNTPHWIDGKGQYYEENFHSICTNDFSPVLKQLGRRIVGSLAPLCLSPPALTDNRGILCLQGDTIFGETTCKKSCLDMANFTVAEVTYNGRTTLRKCPSRFFDHETKNGAWVPKLTAAACGSDCPCWRMAASATCKRAARSSPYRVEIMRQGPAPKISYTSVCALKSPHGWGTRELANQPQCN